MKYLGDFVPSGLRNTQAECQTLFCCGLSNHGRVEGRQSVHGTAFFTDGSKIVCRVGVGVFFRSVAESYSLSEFDSVFQETVLKLLETSDFAYPTIYIAEDAEKR